METVVTACPCFGGELTWAHLKIAGSIVDIDRASSCSENNSRITINYAYLSKAREELDGIPFSGTIEGVHYTHLSATFDPEAETYQCANDDTHTMLTRAEAEACHTLLRTTCVSALANMCSCYSLFDLVKAEKAIANGDVTGSKENTCVVAEAETDIYGLFEVSSIGLSGQPCENCVMNMFGIQNDGKCFDGSDAIQDSNPSQTLHCQKLMADSCQVLNQASNVEDSVDTYDTKVSKVVGGSLSSASDAKAFGATLLAITFVALILA